jgi:hypothetical protein
MMKGEVRVNLRVYNLLWALKLVFGVIQENSKTATNIKNILGLELKNL